jgi:PhnB protein
MPGVEPYLTFDGNCADAARFYEKAVGAKIEMIMTLGESPMAAEVPAEFHKRVMHCSLRVDGQRLMASDTMPDQPFTGMSGFALSLSYPTVEEGERVFKTLADGGTVTMPLQDTFWVERFGSVTDKFGTPWMVNAGKSKMG